MRPLSWSFVLLDDFDRDTVRTHVRTRREVAVSELRSALDALAADDLFELTAGQVLDRTAVLVQLGNRVAAELTRTVRHAETTQAAEHDGIKTMRSWLIGHARLAPNDASKVVRAGRALEHFPVLAAGFADGHVTAVQFGVVADEVGARERGLAAEQGIDLSAFDQDWAVVAAGSRHESLVSAVQAFEAALDPDGPEPDPTEGRTFTMVKHADGSMTGRFELDAAGAEKAQAAIESIVQADRPKGDERTRTQQNADAFVQLCDNQLAAGNLPMLRTVKPHVVVTIDLHDLVDPATGPGAARTGFGATISAARARYLACDGSISRIVMSPDGVPLDLGRDHRVVTPGLRRAVERRDESCVFTGCHAPSHWCDVHHLVHWVHGGETDLDNSALLCERHHTKVHHGFRVERDPGGRWRTWRPDGTEILLGPLL
nr:HNH endonuclease signature motif containing protein [Modestobacter marinus]